MKDKLSFKASKPLVALRIATVVLSILVLLCSYLSTEDLRTEKELAEARRQEVVTNMLFEDTVEFARAILADPTYICHWSEVSSVSALQIKVDKPGYTGKKVVEIKTEDGRTYCYEYFYKEYEVADDDEYYSIRNSSKALKYCLELSGDDLQILYEEAKK